MTATVTFGEPVVGHENGMPFIGVPSPVGLVEAGLTNAMAAHDFVEEEFFVSGKVAGQPYTTSLLVRRPADFARFSGLIAIEPVHLQGALGLWQTSHDTIMREGHAWAAIGSQRGAVEGPIKMANPARYAGLQVPGGVGDESAAAMDAWSRGDDAAIPSDLYANDAISNAILAQVGATLKAGIEDSPFASVAIASLILGGASQTGMATLNFIAYAHANARMPDGSPIFDGFLPMAAPGRTPIVGCDVPVVQIFAEGDLTLFGSIGASACLAARADSDSPGDRYRCYQIAGATHLPTRGLADQRSLPHFGIELDVDERFSQFPAAPFYQGAFVNLVRWVRAGIAPPHAKPIAITDGKIDTDVHGNALGGVRSPWVDVPVARHIPTRYLRNLIGVEVPFAPHRMFDLYGSREGYLERFSEGIDELVEGGWILSGDGTVLKAEEAALALI